MALLESDKFPDPANFLSTLVFPSARETAEKVNRGVNAKVGGGLFPISS